MDVKTKSLEFMNDSTKWPHWPQLPLVNRKTNVCGYIVDGTIKVYLGNIWDVLDHVVEFENFDSWEEVVEAGWEVD